MSLSLVNGLNVLIPNVSFSGDLRLNDERSYEAIVILNEGIEKPSFEDVYNEALDIYRKEKTVEINLKTSDMIENDFSFSLKPDLVFHMDLVFQFNVQTLFSQRDLLTYPYSLKISSDSKGTPVIMTIEDANEFISFQSEALHYIQTCIHTGVAEKMKISTMTEEELDNYIDPRG